MNLQPNVILHGLPPLVFGDELQEAGVPDELLHLVVPGVGGNRVEHRQLRANCLDGERGVDVAVSHLNGVDHVLEQPSL